MYSRYSNRFGRIPTHLPENYSGNAFRNPSATDDDLPPEIRQNRQTDEADRSGRSRNLLPVPFPSTRSETDEKQKAESTAKKQQSGAGSEDDVPLIPPIFPSMRERTRDSDHPPDGYDPEKPSRTSGPSPDSKSPQNGKKPNDFLHRLTGRDGKLPVFGKLDFEELLLIGLILLLSGSEEESDVALVLALLLLCG